MTQFKEQLQVVALQYSNGETPTIQVTLKRPDNSTFILTDAVANAGDYPFMGSVLHTVGS